MAKRKETALASGTMVRYARAFIRNIQATNMPEIANRRGIVLETGSTGQMLICNVAWNDGSTSWALRQNLERA